MQATTRRLLVAMSLLGLLPQMAQTPAAAQRRGDCRGMGPAGSHGVMIPIGEPGDPMRIDGQVVGRDGSPLVDVRILAYQTDHEGYYSSGGSDESNARICVVVATDEDGRYSLETIRPGAYPTGGVAQHVHFELWGDGISRRRRDLQFADDERVPARRKADPGRFSTVQPVARDDDGVWRVVRDFRLD